jgi:hypothetical protein
MDKYEKLNETFDVEPIEVSGEKMISRIRLSKYVNSK